MIRSGDWTLLDILGPSRRSILNDQLVNDQPPGKSKTEDSMLCWFCVYYTGNQRPGP
jgi:hypothetical protein